MWVGTKDQLNEDGSVVLTEAYPTSYASSHRAQWGQVSVDTSSYSNGNDLLFETDCYGSTVQEGNCPFPTTPQGNQAVLEATSALLRNAFDFAATVGVRTCVGTETPLSKPPVPNPNATTQDYYEGIFTRIMKVTLAFFSFAACVFMCLLVSV